MKIAKDSWAITERVIRRYPETKKEYMEAREEIISASPSRDGQPGGTELSDQTARKAERLAGNKKLCRLELEIKAVEEAYSSLSPEWQKVVRVRFWSNRWKNMPYMWMEIQTSYREAQLKRIAGTFVKMVARNLGEI